MTDEDVSKFPETLPNLHTLSVALNQITDVGLSDLLGWAPDVVVLDLEANEIVFAIWTQAITQLWRANSPLRHLNVSHNIPTIQSLTGFCWGVGLSRLITLDAAMSDYPVRHVPARLLTFLLLNKSLERVNLRGIRFCTMVQRGLPSDPELYPGGPIGKDLAEHPRLRSILLDKNLLWARNTVASV